MEIPGASIIGIRLLNRSRQSMPFAVGPDMYRSFLLSAQRSEEEAHRRGNRNMRIKFMQDVQFLEHCRIELQSISRKGDPQEFIERHFMSYCASEFLLGRLIEIREQVREWFDGEMCDEKGQNALFLLEMEDDLSTNANMRNVEKYSMEKFAALDSPVSQNRVRKLTKEIQDRIFVQFDEAMKGVHFRAY